MSSPNPRTMDRSQELQARLLLLKAVAEENRLAILEALRRRGEMNVSQICDATGIDISTISHHLTCLKNCGLVATRREGKYLHYALNGQSRVGKLLELVQAHVDDVREGILACEITALHPILRPRRRAKRKA